MKIVDINTTFGHWPIQLFTHRTLQDLDCALANNGIEESWLSATESILFDDPDVHDLPLFEQLRKYPRFRPVKTVNPLMANWQQSVYHAIEHYPLAALKIYPNYHNYPANHEALWRLSEIAAEHNLPVQVSLRVNDERNQPRVLRVPPTNIDGLLQWIPRFPNTRFIMLCPYWSEIGKLIHANNVYIDISFLDHADVLKRLLTVIKFPVERVLFGSHACFLYPESSALKLKFTECAADIQQAIAQINSRQMLQTK